MIAAVVTDQELYLRAWRSQALWVAAAASAAVLVILYTFYFLLQVVRRREEFVLENERLRTAAEAANKAKSQFWTMISHEIRTPMNGIIGTSELLASAHLQAQEKRLAEMLVRSGRQLLGILNDVLDFSKIEAGELTVNASPYDPRGVLREVHELFDAVDSSKGLSLEYRCAAEVPRSLVGDAGRVRQIVIVRRVPLQPASRVRRQRGVGAARRRHATSGHRSRAWRCVG